jgi:HEAT repeat protein
MNTPAAADALIAYWKQAAPAKRGVVTSKLVSTGDPRVPELLFEAFRNEADPRAKSQLAFELARLKDAKYFEPLAQAFQAAAGMDKNQLASALARTGDARAFDLLKAHYEQADEQLKSGAARALGESGDERAADILLDALDKCRPEQRSHFIQALGATRSAKAAEKLAALMKIALQNPKHAEGWALYSALSSLLNSVKLQDAAAVSQMLEEFRDKRTPVPPVRPTPATRALPAPQDNDF